MVISAMKKKKKKKKTKGLEVVATLDRAIRVDIS